jgi:osmotically-inducible protein OsmY
LNEITIDNVNDKTADDMDGRIRSDLKDMVDKDQVLRDRDINFDVNNGVVTVKGEVRTPAEKSKVSDLVKSAPGVKDFANALEIKPKK